MASGGSIVVRIFGDDAQLQEALARAKKGLDQLGSHMKTGAASAAKFSAAVVAVGAALTAALVTKQSKAIETTASLARSLDTTTESLVAVQYAAKEGGLEGLDGALTRLNRRLGAAEFGAGAAAVTVKALNLDLEALSRMPVDERLASIADTIRDSGMSYQQAARHLQNLGFEQKEAVQLFMQGGDVFRSAREEVEALGLAFSDVDAAQVEAANAAMGRIKNVIDGVGRQLTIQLAPFIEEVASRISGLADESGGFREAITRALEIAMRGMGKVANAIQYVRIGLKALVVGFQGVGSAALGTLSLIDEGWRRIIAEVAEGIQWLAQQLSRIPGVEIPTEGLERLREGLEADAEAQIAFRNQLSESFAQARQELHDLAMQPMPGDQVEAFLQAVRDRSREAAEEVAAARAAMAGGGAVDGRAEEEAERHRKEIADRIERIRQGLLTEREVELEAYAEKVAALNEARALELLSEEEHRAQIEAVEKAHWERMGEIRKAGMTALERFTSASFGSQVKTVASDLANMTASVARENKAMFEINKVAGIATATMNAYKGISETWNAYPYPLNVGMTAAHAAAAFAQVNAIRSQSFGGGGGSAPSLAGGTPATPVTPVQGGVPGGSEAGSDIVFQLRGQSFGPDAIADIARGLGDFITDGGRIRNVRVEQF